MRWKSYILPAISVLLGIWYLVSIVGIDVHVDHHDGEVFVVSLLGRTDCESLHPEDECHCMEHHHGMCHEDDEDCENLISILSLTGDGFHFSCNLAPELDLLAIFGAACPDGVSSYCLHPAGAFHAPPRAHLSCLCVLRV